jgi:uncharacterized protein YcfJ
VKRAQKSMLLMLLMVLSGCATLPTGPSVNVLPTQGKPFATFQTEDATCRQWAQQQMGMPTQQTYDKNVATGAVAGTAIGAGLGAALGSASGHAGAGALVGAGLGLFAGTATGANAGQATSMETQRRYDNSYVQCMYSYGNQVPGYQSRVVQTPPEPVVMAPPPPPSQPVVSAPAPPPSPASAQAYVPPPDAILPPPEVMPEPGQYPMPSEVYLDESPQFVFSPTLNLYVAVGVPYDLVFNGVDYYYAYGGRWYRGPFYNGPWMLAGRRQFPKVLLRYSIANIRYYRDYEYGRYTRDRTHYDGKIHRPEFRGEKRKAEHLEEHR